MARNDETSLKYVAKERGYRPRPLAASERRLRAMIPLDRIGSAEGATSANLFLASDEAAYIQGAELVVDGGILGSAGAPPPNVGIGHESP